VYVLTYMILSFFVYLNNYFFYRYFKMIAFACDLCPEKICGLSVKLLQQLLASVELGLYSFGNEVASFCCDTIQVLTKHIHKEVTQGHPRKDIMAPFLNVSFYK